MDCACGAVVVKPFPVLYACSGCAQFGYSAARVAQRLDERGLVEAVWLGATPQSGALTTRFPILTLDACEKGCARAWVESRGGRAEQCFVLSPLERVDTEGAVRRVARALT
jgi:uncharacterized metal-binding protein